MELLNPSLGIIFWTLLAFLIVVFLLSKFAWKPIIAQLKQREDTIASSVKKAQDIEKQLKETEIRTQQMLKDAYAEQQSILAEAKKIYDEKLQTAILDAKQEGERISQATMQSIQADKDRMIQQVKEEAVGLIIEVAEQVLKSKLNNSKDNSVYIKKLISELPANSLRK